MNKYVVGGALIIAFAVAGITQGYFEMGPESLAGRVEEAANARDKAIEAATGHAPKAEPK